MQDMASYIPGSLLIIGSLMNFLGNRQARNMAKRLTRLEQWHKSEEFLRRMEERDEKLIERFRRLQQRKEI